MTAAELLPLLNGDARTTLTAEFEALALGLAHLQGESGLWRTILDDPEAYPESSASAMYLFAFAKARKEKLLALSGDTVIDRAFAGLADCVDEEGKFIKTSEGTWPGTIEYYKSLKTGEWWWGTGAYLLALSEFVTT